MIRIGRVDRRGLAHLVATRVILVALMIAGGLTAPGDARGAREVRVGVYQNPPKIFSTNGAPAGVLIEVLQAIAEREDWQLSYVNCEWQACLTAVERGEIDLMPDVAHTEERSRRFDFHRTPALHSWSQVYSRDDAGITSLLDLRGRRIATLVGSVQEQALGALLGGFDLEVEIVPTATPEESFRLTASGRADAAIASHHFGSLKASSMGLVETPIVFLPARLFYVTTPGRNADLLARIDVHLDSWQLDPGSPYFRIVKHWGGPAPEALVPVAVRNALLVLAGIGLALGGGVMVLRRQVATRTRELLKVNHQLSATLDAIPDLLFEVDATGRYVEIHTNRSDQLTAPAASLIGTQFADTMPAAAAAVCMEALDEAQAEGWSGGRQFCLVLPAGETWFELSVARKPKAAGDPLHFLILSRDISARKRAEARVQQLTRLYATLSQCNQAIVRCSGEADLLPAICEAAVVHGGFKLAWVGMIDAEQRCVAPVASHGEGRAFLDDLHIPVGTDDPLGRGPSGTSIREDRPYWCQDYVNDPATLPWRERGIRFGWGSSAALPLHRGGKVIGLMNLYAGDVNAFDEPARNLLLEMAMDIDFALDRFEQDAERRRLAEEIVHNEEKYRELTESINDVIWTLDPHTLRFLYVSPSVTRLRGYTPAEVMSSSFEAALVPESARRVRHLVDTRVAGFLAGTRTAADSDTEEVEQPCKDGSTVWTEIVVSLARDRQSGELVVRGVTRDISERKRAELRIQELAHFDQLTGLPNRTLLKDRCRYVLNHAERNHETLAVLFLDLDHFKHINDSLGHDVGDQLLVEVARRLGSAMRECDTLARLGGDEFILILPDTDADAAGGVAARLLKLVAAPCTVASHELSVTPSIGIAMYPEDGSDMDLLSRNADAAMYRAKREGRNGFCFFTAEMQAHSVRALTLANALRFALERDQLSLRYQPQISLDDESVVGAEALLRWHHPELGEVSPTEFIPVAENSGLILEIGEWVLRQAVAQTRLWMDADLPALVMAVNLSAVQFRHPDLPAMVTRIVDEFGLPPGRLELELTEAVAMGDPLTAIEVMDSLFERGIRMAIDDFGTGYSSLSHLKRFKADKLKIDQSFVRDIAVDADDKAIVTAIIHLADSLGVRTIAEGVETAEQLAFLREQGCAEVQGYFFSRPLSPADFESYVRRTMSGAVQA